jgi:hypothetical protein
MPVLASQKCPLFVIDNIQTRLQNKADESHNLELETYTLKNQIHTMFCSHCIYVIEAGTNSGRHGRLDNLSKFDNSMFGVHAAQANTMDPQLRMLLEVTYEALLDAGMVCCQECIGR